jgi:hypothetical protein
MRKQGVHELIRTVRNLHSLDFSRGVSGIIFENICHQKFRDEIRITYLPMVRLVRDNPINKVKWHSSHRTFKNQELEGFRREASRDHCYTLHLRPSKIIQYDDERISLQSDTYYIPRRANEVAFNSFICHEGILYIFRFTVSKEHDINDKPNSWFAKCTNVPKPDNWRYIFVVPKSVKHIESRLPTSQELQWLQPYSSQVSMRDLEKSAGSPESSGDSSSGMSTQEGDPGEESEAVQESGTTRPIKKTKLTHLTGRRQAEGVGQ